LLKTKCVYAIIFEGKIKNNNYKYKGFKEIPRPFVLEPPMNYKVCFKKGEEIKLGLVLFGDTAEFLPYIIYTFVELGKIGLGINSGKYDLQEVLNYKGEQIYNSKEQKLYNKDSTVELDFVNYDKNTINIKFLSPTRIKVNGKYDYDLNFVTFIRSLLRRITAINFFYLEKELDIDYKKILLESQRIKTKNKDLKYVPMERYSTRQKQVMDLGGIVGEIEYEGQLKSFVPLIKIGEYTHIGKNTTFGLGKYEINI
jgi:CRISPR-associated endoribonuclease Cas6